MWRSVVLWLAFVSFASLSASEVNFQQKDATADNTISYKNHTVHDVGSPEKAGPQKLPAEHPGVAKSEDSHRLDDGLTNYMTPTLKTIPWRFPQTMNHLVLHDRIHTPLGRKGSKGEQRIIKEISQEKEGIKEISQEKEGIKKTGQEKEEGIKEISQEKEGTKKESQEKEGIKEKSQEKEGIKKESQEKEEGIKEISQEKEGTKKESQEKEGIKEKSQEKEGIKKESQEKEEERVAKRNRKVKSHQRSRRRRIASLR
ncbi:hypothetical protein Bbelb_010630 [Branchiostoma belcheri]|nr:hypothetical protein Bbelb_010630 [Branchiostoma belcheri]